MVFEHYGDIMYWAVGLRSLLGRLERPSVVGFCAVGDGLSDHSLAFHHGFDVHAAIGDNTILNTGCIVEHEVVVGLHNHIAPHVTICGRTRIGDLVMIGAGATVIDGIQICSNVIVGAGATVVRDIMEPGVYVDTPAVRIAPYPASDGG